MNASEFDKLATPVDELLSRGYLAIGLILCLINEKREWLLFEENSDKSGIKINGEWGLPAETCKHGERLRDTVSRCFIEEMHLSEYDGVVYPHGGYYETNFIDEIGLGRVIILKCDSKIFSPDPKKIVSTDNSSNEISDMAWLSVRDVYKARLRRGILNVVKDADDRVDHLLNEDHTTQLTDLLSGAIVHAFSEDIAPKR
ncbi:hypothetical protein COX94_01020 [Candidatus Nomurabacteria bacterium CG_4_10_14_0_2_um_filter_33_9]|uniref:Nudix hydrolase domain-containing protein n=1 Tax=Candidatus Nomurabacteria bacterium CG_4_10_14_0_2_um_filter_33_9 TaxID=1974728 RepID=A0A2J0MLU7_9BACT|nr:MAG: hypothetical protein COX94_01020 [Candidatus Nomurabacteria bacterium CG_4_10_14_0_2_um_filter_33_9]